MNNQILGNYLKNLRKEKKLSQDELSTILGVKRQTYSTYETGRIFPPTDILVSIAKFYDVSFDEFIKSSDENAPKFSAASLLYSSKSFERESQLLSLFRNIELRDQEDVLDFLKLKAHQYRNNINPHEYL